MHDCSDQELRGRDRLQGTIRSNHNVSQLARAITADSLAVEDAALEIHEFRPNGQKHVATDAPAEVCFLAPARARGEGSGNADGGNSSSNRVSEPALQTYRLVVSPARIERDLFDNVWCYVVRADSSRRRAGRPHYSWWPDSQKTRAAPSIQYLASPSRLSADPRRTDRRRTADTVTVRREIGRRRFNRNTEPGDLSPRLARSGSRADGPS